MGSVNDHLAGLVPDGGSLNDRLAALPAGLAGTYGAVLPASNGSDDTAAIQAVLTAGAGKLIKGRPGESYIISEPLVIASDTTLDMTSCTVTLAAGSLCNMIVNTERAAGAGGSGRDSNITITGGTWDRGANSGVAGLDRHSIMLQRVDGCDVSNLTYTSTDGKFGVFFYACTGFKALELTFDCSSDGVHMSGTCSNGLVSGIFGSTGDDSVAITSVDYAAYNDGDLGDVHDIVIERVYTDNSDSTGNTVKVLAGNIAGTPTTVSNVTIHDISGSSAQAAVYLGGDTADAGTQDGILRDIEVDRVNNRGTGHCVVFIENTFDSVTLRRLRSPQTALKFTVQITQGAVIGTLNIEDTYFTPPASTYGVNLPSTTPQPSVAMLRFTRCRLNPATKAAGLIGTASVFTTLANVAVDDIYIDQAAWAIGDLFTNTNLFLSNVRAINVNGWFNVRAGATVDVKAASGLVGNVSQIANAGTTYARALGFPVDVGTLTLVANGMAFNSNAARACGAGPVVCNGTSWKHLYTDTTYTP